MQNINKRVLVFAAGVAVFLLLLVFRLGALTLAAGSGEDGAARLGGISTRTITLKGERGSIVDRNGQPLAYNEVSYNIEFLRDVSRRTEVGRALDTEIIYKTIQIIESYGGTTIDTFNIYRREPGTLDDEGNELPEYYFYWGGGLSAEAEAAREENWRTNMSVGNERTPEEIYNYLRRLYQIPEDMEYEEARKLLSVWQEVQLSTWRSYIPVVIAYDVSEEAVAEIETRSSELTGMSAAQSTTRVYPKKTTAAHLLGYLGKMQTDEIIEKYTNLGYSQTDSIGISGIEQSMEEELSGNSTEHQGSQVVEVDSSGQIIRVLSTELPTDGNDVVLTIDLELQQVLESALEENITTIRAEQEAHLAQNPEDYVDKVADGDLSSIDLCSEGSAVVLNAKTGEVLASASYPSYDVNLFTNGISAENYNALLEQEGNPLFNKAIASRMAPGSVFKVAIALAGLEEGVITMNEIINDEGYYTAATESGSTAGAPRCWVYPNISRHQDQNVVDAIKNSCNYYFYEVANRLGIDLINKWCHLLGLDMKTGIEVAGEAQGQIGGQDVLFDNEGSITGVAYLVYRQVVGLLNGYLETLEREVDAATVEACAERLVRLVDENEQIGSDIRRIMREDLGIPEAVSNTNGWSAEIASSLSELRWNRMQTVRTGIGQAVVTVTPIEVARYIAAIINGGNVYEVSVIRSVIDPDGKTLTEFEPELLWNIDVSEETLAALKEGMREVVSLEDGGSAGDYFANYKYKNEIGGKTGTAQTSTSRASNIDLENTAWFVAFAPYDDPEIVVAVCIPNGWAGARAYITVQQVIEFYLDRANSVAAQSVLGDFELIQ